MARSSTVPAPALPLLAAAYIRVSTDEQTEYSPDTQLAEIRKYAAAHGYLVPDEFVFVDEGISGKHTGKRQAFQQMIGLAKTKPKPFDAVLLWKFSRFARNREDSIVYKSMLRRPLGIEVISISEPLADDKTSILMEAIIEAMDEYYSINLAEEVKRGMTEARRGGLQNTPPFGYRVEDHMLVPVPEEAALVQALFQRFQAGDGLFPLAKWINSLGVTTHRGGRFENRTVEYILRNPAYIGKLRWNPSGRTCRDFTNENIILSDAQHEPLISQELWDAVQVRMAQVKAQHKYHGRPLSEARDWVTGLVRCSSCGTTLIFAKPHYWKCNNYVRGGCKTSQHISDEKLKGMILSRMQYDASGASPRPTRSSGSPAGAAGRGRHAPGTAEAAHSPPRPPAGGLSGRCGRSLWVQRRQDCAGGPGRANLQAFGRIGAPGKCLPGGRASPGKHPALYHSPHRSRRLHGRQKAGLP